MNTLPFIFTISFTYTTPQMRTSAIAKTLNNIPRTENPGAQLFSSTGCSNERISVSRRNYLGMWFPYILYKIIPMGNFNNTKLERSMENNSQRKLFSWVQQYQEYRSVFPIEKARSFSMEIFLSFLEVDPIPKTWELRKNRECKIDILKLLYSFRGKYFFKYPIYVKH